MRAEESPGDEKLTSLDEFTGAVVSDRGEVRDHPAYRRFLHAGYSSEQALEVILGVAQKTLSNYSNHLLEARRWRASAAL